MNATTKRLNIKYIRNPSISLLLSIGLLSASFGIPCDVCNYKNMSLNILIIYKIKIENEFYR